MDLTESLVAAFRAHYPDSAPPRVCRAPGRVNLIGEHMDYNGLPVLPMAMEEAIYMAFAPRADGRVHIANMDTQYPVLAFDNAPALAPSPPGSWDNYVKAAVSGLNAYFETDASVGMNILVDSTLRTAEGLSSSSALVVASALAYLACLDKELGDAITKLELADLLASAEQFVGTRGGGMDQAVILCGEQGCAAKIDFYPLRLEHVPVPEDHALFVCSSLVRVEKSGEALHRFNMMPASCRLLAAIVNQEVQRQFGEEVMIDRLGDLWLGPLCLTYDEAEEIINAALPHPLTTLEEAADILGMDAESLRGQYFGDIPVPAEGLPLQARARHLRTEFRRVETARDALLAGDAEAFAAQMNASHTSCRNDFFISSEQLDTLVGAARKAGALGARLTGAGFGGCTVNLVPLEKAGAFPLAVEEAYYRDYLGASAGGNGAIRRARSGAGAGYIATA